MKTLAELDDGPPPWPEGVADEAPDIYDERSYGPNHNDESDF